MKHFFIMSLIIITASLCVSTIYADEEGCESTVFLDDFGFYVPLAVYTDMFGTYEFWLEFDYAPSSDSELLWELTASGAIDNTVEGEGCESARFTEGFGLYIPSALLEASEYWLEFVYAPSVENDLLWELTDYGLTDSLLFNLPDTGQTKSYTDIWGEDSDYTINPPSYTDNADGTVTDNNTGLMWQQEDNSTEYNWYMASGTYDDEYNPDTTDVCGNLILSNYNDWRLPTLKELSYIIDYGNYQPAVDTTYFPTTKSAPYWTANTDAREIYVGNAWNILFSYGYGESKAASDNAYVRCVRGAEDISNNFTDNDNGTVTDNHTGLLWQNESSDIQRNWEDALTYCEDLTFVGFDDWRLPNINELMSITDYGLYEPVADIAFFSNIKSSPYWSSTADASFSIKAWHIGFGYGNKHVANGKSGEGYALCVRNRN